MTSRRRPLACYDEQGGEAYHRAPDAQLLRGTRTSESLLGRAVWAARVAQGAWSAG